MLVGTTIAGMAVGDPGRYAAIAALTALVVAAVSVTAWALRLSSLVNFVSETILLGFKAGAALTIAMTQLPKLFGIKGGGEGFFERASILVSQLPGTNTTVLMFGLAAIALLVLGEKLLPGRPVALAVVIAAIVVLSVTPLAQAGFKVVGVLPSGLPDLARPSLRISDVDGIIGLALACFLLAYIEGVSAARTFAQKNGYEVDPRQELLALGAANAAVAFGHGYPVAGGLSQSTVNDKAGAKTALALVFASVAIALCLLFLTDLIRNLPDVVLAAIVLVAVKGLINISELRRTFVLSKLEFWVAMVAFVGVLLFGILKGVLIAAIVSMLLLIRRATIAPVKPLGHVPGTTRYAELARTPVAEALPGILVIRVEVGLLYFNAGNIRDQVLRLAAEAGPTLRLVVWDLSTSPYVDIGGVRMLAEVRKELAGRNVELRLAEAHSMVRDLLRKDAPDGDGAVGERRSVDEAVRA
jgi:MFS superfamily sulfate permease-like transporter